MPPAATSHFAELLDFLPDVLAWVKDRQGRYLWVNRAFLIQYSLDHPVAPSVLGKTDYDLSPPFLADQFRLDDEQVLAGHRIVNRLERLGDSQGTAVWHVTDKIPVADAKGVIIGTAGITRAAESTSGLDAAAPGFGPGFGFGPALAYMRGHFQQDITNRQLASVSNMSLRAFERRFLATFHLTPQRFLRKLRLRIASRAVVYSEDSLSDIALSCGFADQSHFSREFRRQFGRTPRDYREHYRQR
jgi:AraC-like DNA-binding protein